MLHRDADARDSNPATEAHENRLAPGLDQLYDIGIHADSRHRHNDEELGQRLERRKHACRYADRGAHRGDDGREHEVQNKHRERALEREGFAALALLGLGLVGAPQRQYERDRDDRQRARQLDDSSDFQRIAAVDAVPRGSPTFPLWVSCISRAALL